MPSFNVAADMCSSDSLSLTGLVCSQEELSKSNPTKSQEPCWHRKTTKVSENDINFEFSYSAQSPVPNLHKKSPSNGLFDLTLNQQSQLRGKVTMKDVLEPQYKGKKPGSNKETGNTRKKMNSEVGKYGSKEQNGGFAHKLMLSITTPCRSCSAVEPSAAVKRMQEI